MTPKEIFETKISNHLKENPSIAAGVNATYLFDVSGDQGGQWHITLNGSGGHVQAGPFENPQCIIIIKDQDLVNLVEGTLNPQMAFMTGKLRVKGDIALALKLGSILKT